MASNTNRCIGARLLRVALACFAVAPGVATADGTEALVLRNLIEQCVSFDVTQPITTASGVHVIADIRLLRPTAECGCTSKYFSYTLMRAKTTVLYKAYFSLDASHQRRLQLSRSLPRDASGLTLLFGCRGA